MSMLLELLNQLAATWIAQAPAAAPFAVRSVRLGAAGLDVTGELRHPRAAGPAALRVTVEPVATDRFTLHVTPTGLPPELAPELAAYRDVLERLHARVDLDFTAVAPGEVPA